MTGPKSSLYRHLADELEALEKRGLRRKRSRTSSRDALVLCSNDYLGYASEPDAARPVSARFGAGASRLISGTHPEHEALEREVAGWLGTEDALAFSSGYAANVGLLSALAGPDDLVVSDALNHASIIDGVRLARARVAVVPHGDVDAVRDALARGGAARRRFVVTESYFSMDGDVADVARLLAIADQHDAALLVDEAHALGVFGPEGRGVCAEAGVVPDALVGTFGKALGGQGAFVTGSRVLCDWLWNRARSFVFSTGVSPAVAAHALQSIRRARHDDAGRRRVHAIAERVRASLRELGYRVGDASTGPIVPVIVGSEEGALALSRALADRGVVATAIRPPTVPPGTSRLRVTVHAALRDQDVDRAIAAFREVVR